MRLGDGAPDPVNDRTERFCGCRRGEGGVAARPRGVLDNGNPFRS